MGLKDITAIIDAYQQGMAGQVDPQTAMDNSQPSTQINTPQMVINPRTKIMSFANPIEEAQYKAQLAAQGKFGNKSADLQADVNQSALTSQYNLNLSAESLHDYSKLLAQAWREGGAGNIIKGSATKLAMKGLPIGGGEKYKASGALPGKLVEIVSKTFPMLTQQIGKEGSVRLIESVFSKLGSSYPNENTPPEMAPEQIRQSLLSMYRINRALEGMDISKFDLTKKDAEGAFAARIAKEVGNIEFSPEEQKTFDALANKVLEPINAQLELNRRAKLKKDKK